MVYIGQLVVLGYMSTEVTLN